MAVPSSTCSRAPHALYVNVEVTPSIVSVAIRFLALQAYSSGRAALVAAGPVLVRVRHANPSGDQSGIPTTRRSILGETS